MFPTIFFLAKYTRPRVRLDTQVTEGLGSVMLRRQAFTQRRKNDASRIFELVQ